MNVDDSFPTMIKALGIIVGYAFAAVVGVFLCLKICMAVGWL